MITDLLSVSLSLSHTHIHKPLFLSLTHTCINLSLSLSLTHTHTHTHKYTHFLLFKLEPAEKKMDPRNHSPLTEFILTGLTEQPQLQLPLFLLFLGIYVITVMGNQDMITLIGLSSHMHTPM